MEVRLVVREGKAKGREIPLPLTNFVIGRGKHAMLLLEELVPVVKTRDR